MVTSPGPSSVDIGAENCWRKSLVKITVFSSAIVIDVIDRCDTAGRFLSQTAENICPYHRVVWF